ncbi:hypothetical protein ACIRBX_36055 [Kitasatospora sp. NPDC096147]|uniref:hypothetical protein n=1 Tax=Kitasatospora sp. NPDC096147 TaxID=3364093 RepID=UPI00380AED8C
MNILAGDWWSAGAFWQYVITTVVGVLVGALAAWATIRSANPKRVINWWVKSNTSLIVPQLPAGGGGLTVQLGGQQLQKPRIVELVITNEGSRDITAAMFHNNASIRFGFDGTNVCAVLSVDTQPTGTVLPSLDIGPVVSVGTARLAEDWVDVLPSLLSRGQAVTVTVLVDGDEKDVRCIGAPLVDVEVTNHPRGGASGLLSRVELTPFSLSPLPIRIRFGK